MAQNSTEKLYPNPSKPFIFSTFCPVVPQTNLGRVGFVSTEGVETNHWRGGFLRTDDGVCGCSPAERRCAHRVRGERSHVLQEQMRHKAVALRGNVALILGPFAGEGLVCTSFEKKNLGLWLAMGSCAKPAAVCLGGIGRGGRERHCHAAADGEGQVCLAQQLLPREGKPGNLLGVCH